MYATRFVLCSTTLALVATTLAPGTAWAAPPAPGPLAIRQVRGAIHEVTGGAIANTGLFIGPTEVLAIDAKMSPEATRDLVARLKKLTPNPVTLVALTHSDHDHVDGLPGYPGGVRVIAHRNARRDLEQAFTDAARRAYLPSLTFTEEMDLHFGPTTVRLLHFGPAHTNGDVVVYFPKEKVAFIGDLLFIGRDPLIHRKKGGSSTGLVTNLKAILKLDADTFVHGHGPAAGRAAIEDLVRRIEETRAKVLGLVAKRRSLAEIKRALAIEDHPVPPGGVRWPSLVEIIYAEATEKK